MLKHTPLVAVHQQLGARLVEFGGWEMPVHYTSIMDEHQAVRSAAGIFDISHMGEVFVSGAGALGFLNETLTNDLSKLMAGRGQYTLLCNERGGVIDDLYAYCVAPQRYLLVVNAARIDADLAWLRPALAGSGFATTVEIDDASARLGAIAIQGPRVAEFIDAVLEDSGRQGVPVRRVSELQKNEITSARQRDHELWVSRTGYTGEDGFEIVGANEAMVSLWQALREAGRDFGLKPCGLGARDTLRTEMCYPLYGHELDEQTTPIEAGVGFFVAFDKGDFTGREVLWRQKSGGAARRCVAFKMTGTAPPPRPHYGVWSNDAQIGTVSSGTQSPSLGVGIGMAFVGPEFTRPGTALSIDVRGRRFPAEVVGKPIYRKAV